MVNDK